MKTKTLKSVSKRFKKCSYGKKLKYKHSNIRHILIKKNSKLKRKLRKKNIISKYSLKRIINCLPYLYLNK